MAKLWHSFRNLFRDLFILIVGILISLWINGRADYRSARADEKRIMQQIVKDLATDTLTLEQASVAIGEMIETAAYITTPAALQPHQIDSTTTLVWSLTAYLPLGMQQTAFYELSYQDQHRNIQQPELASRFVGLHEGMYALIERVTDQHGDYILNNFAPYLNTRLPSSLRSLQEPTQSMQVKSQLLNSSEMQNKIDWMHILLYNVKEVLTASKQEAVELLEDVKTTYDF